MQEGSDIFGESYLQEAHRWWICSQSLFHEIHPIIESSLMCINSTEVGSVRRLQDIWQANGGRE